MTDTFYRNWIHYVKTQVCLCALTFNGINFLQVLRSISAHKKVSSSSSFNLLHFSFTKLVFLIFFCAPWKNSFYACYLHKFLVTLNGFFMTVYAKVRRRKVSCELNVTMGFIKLEEFSFIVNTLVVLAV